MVDHLQLVQLPCIGHTLQLSVEWGLQATSIARVIGRCKKLAQQFHKSTQLTEGEAETSVNGPSLELIQSCPTRSTYVGTNSEGTAATVCSSSGKPHEIRYLLPDGEGWMIIEELIGVLSYHSHERIIIPNIEYAQSPIVQVT